MAWTAPSGHVYAVGEVVTAATLNTYVGNDLAYLYGDTAWTAPTYTNSWVDLGSGYVVGGFRLVGTRVQMRGEIKSGTIGLSAFTLPSGYRPTASQQFAQVSNTLFGVLDIAATGVVIPLAGSNVAFSISCAFDTI